MKTFKKTWVAMAAASVLLAGCLGSGNSPRSQGDVVILTTSNDLLTFNRTTPNDIRTRVTVTGLVSGDSFIGMDFRPRDRKLYAVARTLPGNGGRLYTIDTNTGVATVVATLTAAVGSTYTTLDPAATVFGVDFNPQADALRVITNTGQNLRIVLNAGGGNGVGATFEDGDINRTDASATPFADSATAYTNAFDGTTSTRMFNIDVRNGNLIQQTVPNNGTSVVAAPLFAAATTIQSIGEFDVDGSNNQGYALMQVAGNLTFYRIALPDSTATLPVAGPAATAVGVVPVSGVVGMSLALPAAPEVVVLDGSIAGGQRLVKFGVRTPNTATTVNITGVGSGERLLSMDYRPSNGKLYALSSAGKIYVIDASTGAATLGSTLSAATAIVNGLADGKQYAIDFNPAADALRIVSTPGTTDTTSSNLRVPGAGLESTGATTTDTALSGGTAGFAITQVAYTNSFTGPAPAATRLFDLDAANNQLLQQTNANGGTLALIGSTTQTFNRYGGFNIAGGDNGMRLVAGRTASTGVFSLFDASLTTGAVTAAAVASGNSEIGTGATQATDVQALTVRF
ncbi:MAG TPA: DUF4394 domain-containing protein [Limnobacter sp.]|uniref:DUF4394 domain-containing protein n=1 Tax=Limnobacter sp. TaxID=2003368 RepID=UPI002ED9C9C7